MLRPIAFWFLRHGETDWNARGLSQGARDVPLNAHGRAQAQRAAELLRDAHLASIVASPFARAKQTATIVARALGLEVTHVPDLHEVVFPGKEGQSLDGWFDAWIGGKTPPGAESFFELTRRAERAIAAAQSHPSPVLVVSHGGFFRALREVMHLRIDVRTPNGVPILCSPPSTSGGSWSLQAPPSLSLVGSPEVSG